MKVLVDTSVWIEHIRKPVPTLINLLSEKRVLIHPLVIGEIACGNFKRRHEVLGNLKILPKAQEATYIESLEFIESQKLHGKGLSFNDVQILCSALLSEAKVFSFDKAINAYKELNFSED